MEERWTALEQRLGELEATVQALGARVRVTEDGGLTVTGPVRVVDSDGKPMAEVDLTAGGPCLRLFHGSGEPAVVLDVIMTGGSVSVRGPDGRPVGLLFSDEAGGDLALYDTEGQVQFSRP